MRVCYKTDAQKHLKMRVCYKTDAQKHLKMRVCYKTDAQKHLKMPVWYKTDAQPGVLELSSGSSFHKGGGLPRTDLSKVQHRQ